MSERGVFESNDISFIIHENLQKSGVSISDNVVRLIVDEYYRVKKGIIQSGDYILEPGMGYISIDVRRLPGTFSENKFTSKIKYDINDEFRRDINARLLRDEELRTKIGADSKVSE